MRCKASSDTFIHWLTNWRSVWGHENRLNVCQVWNGRMRSTVVNDKSNFSLIHAEFWWSLRTQSARIWLFIQLFFCATYLQGNFLTFSKQREFLDLPIMKMGRLSPVALAAPIPVTLTLLFFPSEHFSPLRLSGRHC